MLLTRSKCSLRRSTSAAPASVRRSRLAVCAGFSNSSNSMPSITTARRSKRESDQADFRYRGDRRKAGRSICQRVAAGPAPPQPAGGCLNRQIDRKEVPGPPSRASAGPGTGSQYTPGIKATNSRSKIAAFEPSACRASAHIDGHAAGHVVEVGKAPKSGMPLARNVMENAVAVGSSTVSNPFPMLERRRLTVYCQLLDDHAGVETEHRPGVRLRGPRETQFDVDVECATRVDDHVAAELADFRGRIPSLLVSRQPCGALVEISNLRGVRRWRSPRIQPRRARLRPLRIAASSRSRGRATQAAAKARKPTAPNRTDPRCRNVRASGMDVVKSDTKRSGASASNANSQGGMVDSHRKCRPRSPIATIATASRLRRTAASSITVAAPHGQRRQRVHRQEHDQRDRLDNVTKRPLERPGSNAIELDHNRGENNGNPRRQNNSAQSPAEQVDVRGQGANRARRQCAHGGRETPMSNAMNTVPASNSHNIGEPNPEIRNLGGGKARGYSMDPIAWNPDTAK